MTRRIHCLLPLATWLLCAGAVPGGPPPANPAPQIETYSKATPLGKIVITRTPITNKEAVLALAPERLRNRPQPDFLAFSVQLQLQPEKGEPVTLATKLQWENGAPISGFHPLDVVVNGDSIIVPVAIGGQISIWRVQFQPIALDSWTQLDARWSRTSLGRPKMDDKMVRVTMKKLPDGRWSVEIKDLEALNNTRVPALFEQEANTWSFKLIHDGSGNPPRGGR